MTAPAVFLSYAWDSADHQDRVKRLCDHLRASGIDAQMDLFDVQPGQDLNAFMERSMTSPDIDKVLLLLTPGYKKKADAMTGGVGQETNYARASVMKNVDQQRFIPVMFTLPVHEDGTPDWDASTPIFLSGRKALALHDDATWANDIDGLLRYLYGHSPQPAPLGPRPAWAVPNTTPANRTALITALATVCRQYPAGTDPLRVLLSGPNDFTILQDDPIQQNLDILEVAGWITQTFMGVATPDHRQSRVYIQGTPQLSRALREPAVQDALRQALATESPRGRTPVPTPAITSTHQLVNNLAQSKWGLGEKLDELVSTGQRQRLAEILTAAFTQPTWTELVKDWVDTTPSLRALPWLPELMMDSLATDLTAAHASQRYDIVNHVMTAAVDGSTHRAMKSTTALLQGLQSSHEWENAHWNLLVACVEPFWIQPDRELRPATPALTEQREQVVRALLRAAREAADAEHGTVTNGIWTALSAVLYDTGDEDLLGSLAGVRGVQDQAVMTTLTDETIGDLVNALDHARRTRLTGEDREMRQRLIDLIAKDALAYARRLPTTHERFAWLVHRAGMLLNTQGEVVSKYVKDDQ